jgi:magnesium-protoporphyrin IX monomethyl ester (oxidative) cyclase
LSTQEGKRVLIVVPYEDVEEELRVRRKVIYPIEPAIVISLLKQNKFAVDGIDLNLCFRDESQVYGLLHEKVVEFRPDILIVMSQHLTFLVKDQYRVIVRIIESIKEADNKIRTIVAGTTPSMYPEKVLNIDARPDVVFRGEIENRILEVISSIGDKERLKRIRGVCVNGGEGLSISDKPNYVDKLDALPIGDRKVFPLGQYFQHPERGNLRYPEKSRRFSQMTATRGCNTGCAFCKVKKLRRRYRWRGTDHILTEIRMLVDDEGVEEIHFLDENLLLNKPRAKQLFRRIIDENLKFQWFCGGGMAVYMLDKELLQLMRKSGCYRLHLALESGSQRILSEIMRKPVELRKAMRTVEYAKHLDFEIIGYFMIGLPTETKDEVLRTVELARSDLFDYVVFSIYTPEIDTPLYDYCVQNELLDRSSDTSDLSKRAESNLVFKEYDREFLTDIRQNVWKEINFSSQERRERIEEMFGCAINEQ